MPTERYPETPVIKGHDFNSGRDIDAIMASMYTTGFQATALGQAVNEVNRMVRHGCSAWGGPVSVLRPRLRLTCLPVHGVL